MRTNARLRTLHRSWSPFLQACALIMSFFLAGLFQAGCAALGKRLKPPHISLAHIQVQKINALESILQIQLRVLNPNELPLKIEYMACELALNGRPFASGLSNDQVVVPAYGQGVVKVKVYSSVLDVFKGILGLKDAEKLRYQIKGKVHLRAGDQAPSVLPFRTGGELSFDSLMK